MEDDGELNQIKLFLSLINKLENNSEMGLFIYNLIRKNMQFKNNLIEHLFS